MTGKQQKAIGIIANSLKKINIKAPECGVEIDMIIVELGKLIDIPDFAESVRKIVFGK